MLTDSRAFRLTSLFLLLVAMVQPVVTASAHVDSTGGLDPQAVEAFADAFFAERLPRLAIPGAVLVVVQDDAVLLAKGYGFSDLTSQTPFGVDTKVRIGSVSKLFVATAVMQLVEDGHLDLDADVGRYLADFELDRCGSQPIAIAHLLTHTGGFDMPYEDFNFDPANIQSLETYVRANNPGCIFPPGEVVAYSNYGYTLLGYIVESVAGVSFEQYVQEHILEPLRMADSSYFYSPPAPEGLATGYSYFSGARAPQPPDYDSAYPAGDLVATGTDIAHFMLAHLNGGCYDAVCILQPETVAEMQMQQVTDHPTLSGRGYGWLEGNVQDSRILGHSGSALGFGNDLELWPEHQLGYFISFNLECLSSPACSIISAFRTRFAEHFFPAESPASPPVISSDTDLHALAGTYRYVWYPHNTSDKIRVLEQPDVQVTDGEGRLYVNGEAYVEVAPLLFQAIVGDAQAAFRQDAHGKTTYMFRPAPYERLAWYETATLTNMLFDNWGWLWAVAAIWPLALGIRTARRRTATQLSGLRWASWLAVLLAVLHIVFLLGLLRFFWISRATRTLTLILPLLAIFVTLVLTILIARMWWRSKGPGFARVYLALLVAMGWSFLLFLNQWNFLGFR